MIRGPSRTAFLSDSHKQSHRPSFWNASLEWSRMAHLKYWQAWPESETAGESISYAQLGTTDWNNHTPRDALRMLRPLRLGAIKRSTAVIELADACDVVRELRRLGEEASLCRKRKRVSKKHMWTFLFPPPVSSWSHDLHVPASGLLNDDKK